MATSKCSKCGSPSFETVNHTPANSRYILLFVQCAACGAVVGVLDAYNIGHSLGMVAEVVNDIARKVGSTKHADFG